MSQSFKQGSRASENILNLHRRKRDVQQAVPHHQANSAQKIVKRQRPRLHEVAFAQALSHAHDDYTSFNIDESIAGQDERRWQDDFSNEQWLPDPQSWLDHGQADPFATLPTGLPHEVISEPVHITRVCLQEMIANCQPNDRIGPEFANRVLAMAVQNQALLYSIVSAGMIFHRATRNIEAVSSMELYVTTNAVRLLSENMSDASIATQESNIWAVFALGNMGAVSQVRTGKLPQQSFLKELQFLHVVGRTRINQVHLQGMIRLISMIGGPQNLKTPGMASMMSFGDLLDATKTLRRVSIPFIPFTNAYLDNGRLAVTTGERSSTNSVLGSLGTAFFKVWQSSDDRATWQLLQVIQHLSDFTVVLENHIEGHIVSRPPAALTDQRNFAQHALMSLPSAQDQENEAIGMCDEQYESCRLGCIIYSLLVVFPLPPIMRLFERIAAKLQRALLNVRMEGGKDHARLELHAWTLTLGAIISIGLPERAWFVQELVVTLQALETEQLAGLTGILRSHLWHPKTSSRNAIELWQELSRARDVGKLS